MGALITMFIFRGSLDVDVERSAYQQEVETCRAHYSNNIEELTKCLDVQLENKE